jgi:DNA gyrase subunit B
VNQRLAQYLEENPTEARQIITKAVRPLARGKQARKARELTRRKSALDSNSLPGRLADCQISDPESAELFLVEGVSAGGSAVDARDRSYQAILPLRGKVINAEKNRINKVLSNEEIQAIITAIGTGIGDEFDDRKLRYHRIIVMTDADVDGAHIRTLILTFLYRQMQELVEGGFVYMAVPPLYRVKIGSQQRYIEKESQFEELLARERIKDMDVTDRRGETQKLTRRATAARQGAERVRRLGLASPRGLRPGGRQLRRRPTGSSRGRRRSRTALATRDCDGYELAVLATSEDVTAVRVVRARDGARLRASSSERVFTSPIYAQRPQDVRELCRDPLGHSRRSTSLRQQVPPLPTPSCSFAEAVADLAPRRACSVSRFKGLGEMDAE